MGKFFKLPFDMNVAGVVGFFVAVLLVMIIVKKLPLPAAIKP